MLNTDQYKEPFAKVCEIFEKHKENPVFTPDGMKSVSIVAAKWSSSCSSPCGAGMAKKSIEAFATSIRITRRSAIS